MSSNIISNKLFTPKNAFVSSVSVASKDNTSFFADILSEPPRKSEESDRTFMRKETNNHIVETEVPEDHGVTLDVDIINDYGLICPAQQANTQDNIAIESISLTESPSDESPDGIPSNVQLQSLDIAPPVTTQVIEGGGYNDITVITQQDTNGSLTVDQGSSPTGDIGIDVYSPVLTLNQDAAITALEQNLGQQSKSYDFNTKNLSTNESQGFSGMDSERKLISNLQQIDRLKINPLSFVEQIQVYDQLDQKYTVSKTIPTDIEQKSAQREVEFVNYFTDDNNYAVSLTNNVSATKDPETNKVSLSFQSIKLQDITKTKQPEQVAGDQSSDSTIEPTMIRSSYQLLMSYQDTENQQDIKIPHLEQVIVAVRSAIAQGKSQILISMYPENLGVVDVRIEFNDSKEVSSIKIFAEKQETLQLLQRDSENLLDSLKIVAKSDDASLSFNLRDGQNEQAHYEKQEGNNNSSSVEDDNVKVSAEEDKREQSSIVNNDADIDITI